jgi:hypothetical protein
MHQREEERGMDRDDRRERGGAVSIPDVGSIGHGPVNAAGVLALRARGRRAEVEWPGAQ